MPDRTDIINISSIRVAGGGGLGLLAMAAALAWAIPRIGQTVALGAVTGLLLAVTLILWRRRRGPLPTSGRAAGANTTLAIDQAGGGAVQKPGPHRRAPGLRAAPTRI